MIRNVLDDYLASINERDFDYPLASLLQAMEFYDIHFTHGAVEFGKDFIAKKLEHGIEYQYAIQSKKGDISQLQWRNEIRGQLEEAVLTDLSHPQFNRNLPRRVVLVTTGRLIGNARLASQEFKERLKSTTPIDDLVFWEKEQLIQFSEQFGLTGIFQNTSGGVSNFAQFYLTYSKAIDGNLSEREIERYSRLWLDSNLEYRKRIFRASIEAEIIASKLVEKGLLYEAIITYLALVKVVTHAVYENNDPFITSIYNAIKTQRILILSEAFFSQFSSEWENCGKSVFELISRNSPAPMLQYIVWCSRALEVAALHYFILEDDDKRQGVVDFIVDFATTEKGTGHVPSDRYTVSIVWPVLALLDAGRVTDALDLVRKAVVWLCDRVEQGFGIARYEADEYEETAVLLGYPFDFIKVQRNTSSFLATALADLAALIGQEQFYSDVLNDFAASEITYSYWQFPDTNALFSVETEECLAFANVTYKEAAGVFNEFDFASHVLGEPKSFRIVEQVGNESLIFLSLLLRDRYFPTAWKYFVSNCADVPSPEVAI